MFLRGYRVTKRNRNQQGGRFPIFSPMDSRSVLKQYWGYDSFRPMQEAIIASVLEGKDTLALLPTGGGKSICFQVPALLQEGICIVVSPLIALMKDQVEQLQQRGIKAISIVSGMNYREIDLLLDNCVHGDIKFLYISPERLQSELAIERIKRMKVNMIAVDEAHCISQWGYDFRPSYLKIAALREILPTVPIMALTATATERVKTDIQERLLFKKAQVFVKSFERENLAYVVMEQEDKLRKLLEICKNVAGTGVVYVRNRKETQELASFLQKQGIKAECYHAGLHPTIRSERQEKWLQNKIRIIVATNAFGMGIDKGDVRFVVHMDLPDSLEAYYQEAGRAGRDGKKAYGVLLWNAADRIKLEKNQENAFPEVETIRKVYQGLGNYFQLAIGAGEGLSYDFDLVDFASRNQLTALQVHQCLKLLEREGYIAVQEDVYLPSRIKFLVGNEALYDHQLKHPVLDPVIKTLLRSYGGLFDHYGTIRETELAKRLQADKHSIIQALQQLHQQEILDYIPQKEGPQIVFMQPRADAKTLRIDTAYLRAREQEAKERMESVVTYVTANQCRSKQLLSYFGEQVKHACGVCDTCLERNKYEVSTAEKESIYEQVQEYLTEPKPSMELLPLLKGMNEEKKLQALRLLLDEGLLELKGQFFSLAKSKPSL